MKRYLFGLLSIFLIAASVLGAQSKAPRDSRYGHSDRDSGPAMWI